MEREEWKSFFCWLDTANCDELRARHKKLLDLLEILQDRGVRGDARRMLKFIEQSLVDCD